MSIEEILDAMDEILDNAKQIPLTGGKSAVDVSDFRDYINQVRLNLPGEIRQAQALVNDRKIIINDARAEADSIIRRAEEKAKQMVSEEVITKQAQQRAHDILTSAQTKAKEIRTATNDYVESMLSRVDELLADNLTDVRKTRASLNKSGKA
ncbi:MAG: ATPase [Eubacterium sp.]|nr:ATPase [Eubacterium sp.]